MRDDTEWLSVIRMMFNDRHNLAKNAWEAASLTERRIMTTAANLNDSLSHESWSKLTEKDRMVLFYGIRRIAKIYSKFSTCRLTDFKDKQQQETPPFTTESLNEKRKKVIHLMNEKLKVIQSINH